MTYAPQRSLWTKFSQRFRVSNTADLVATIIMQLQTTVSRPLSVMLTQLWSTRPCVGQNTMSVIFYLSPSTTHPNFTMIPHTCCLGFILLNCVPAARRPTSPSSIPIHGASLCMSFSLGSSMEESYLSGSLGIYGFNIWVYLHSMPVLLG